MTVASRTERTEVWDWRQLASLGEQLRNENSLAAQRDRIISMTGRLIAGKVDVWLNEKVFRLPDWEQGQHVFAVNPPLDGMKQTVKTGKIYTQNRKTKT